MYFKKETNPHLLHFAMLLLAPDKIASKKIRVPGEVLSMAESDCISMIGVLNKRRIIVAGKNREELGMKYSGFGSHLRFPLINRSTSKEMDLEFGQVAVGKFKPVKLTVSLSRIDMMTRRSSDQIIYKTMLSSAFSNYLQYQDKLPACYDLKPDQKLAYFKSLGNIYALVTLSTDSFYLYLKIFHKCTKKLLSRVLILTSKMTGGVSSIIDVQKAKKNWISLLCLSNARYQVIFVDVLRRKYVAVELPDYGIFSPVLVGDSVFLMEDFLTVSLYKATNNFQSLQIVAQQTISAVGPVADLVAFDFEGMKVICLLNLFDKIFLLLNPEKNCRLLCNIEFSEEIQMVYSRNIKVQSIYDESSFSILTTINSTLVRIDLSSSLSLLQSIDPSST